VDSYGHELIFLLELGVSKDCSTCSADHNTKDD